MDRYLTTICIFRFNRIITNNIARTWGCCSEIYWRFLIKLVTIICVNMIPDFDPLSTLNSSIKQSENRLIVGCFVEKWNKIALSSAQIFEELRSSTDASFADIFVVDMSAHFEGIADYNVSTSPAVIMYWNGQPLVFKRRLWEPTTQVVGGASKEQYLSMLRAARTAVERKKQDIHASQKGERITVWLEW
eukprot:gb/GECH01009853.1/.p1 GENE.gb/GECH01009853.1/~~gb/GECH01009853.1/.p1  ORF type:complete len:190 (+),score=12.76 gb/GECH01009853.1/:1-570(+)